MRRGLGQAISTRTASWWPEEGDAALYAASALFAGVTARFSSILLYRQWGELAVGPYLAAAVASLLVGRYRTRRRRAAAAAGSMGDEAPPIPHWGAARIVIFVGILLGATLLPLALEVSWRAEGGNPSAHVQPETVVIEHSGQRAADGKDPYYAIYKDRHVEHATPGEPAYESFDPYLPLMTVFGLPSSTKEPIRLTDARIFFTMATLLVVTVALALCRGPSERKVRTLQVLTVLPTAALPLATGGDDMPVAALLLLGMVLAQRRRPGWAGFTLGVVSAMKFTAWPLAGLALFAARDRQGRRAPGRMALGMLVITVPVVLPFLLRGPQEFVQNVVLFPLGLVGIASPAASPLPGHILVSAFPGLHRILPITVAVIGLPILLHRLVRRPPATAAEVCTLAGWVMTVAIVFAPATRVGYLLYPINFFVWGYLFRGSEPAPDGPTADAPVAVLAGQSAGSAPADELEARSAPPSPDSPPSPEA